MAGASDAPRSLPSVEAFAAAPADAEADESLRSVLLAATILPRYGSGMPVFPNRAAVLSVVRRG